MSDSSPLSTDQIETITSTSKDPTQDGETQLDVFAETLISQLSNFDITVDDFTTGLYDMYGQNKGETNEREEDANSLFSNEDSYEEEISEEEISPEIEPALPQEPKSDEKKLNKSTSQKKKIEKNIPVVKLTQNTNSTSTSFVSDSSDATLSPVQSKRTSFPAPPPKVTVKTFKLGKSLAEKEAEQKEILRQEKLRKKMEKEKAKAERLAQEKEERERYEREQHAAQERMRNEERMRQFEMEEHKGEERIMMEERRRERTRKVESILLINKELANMTQNLQSDEQISALKNALERKQARARAMSNEYDEHTSNQVRQRAYSNESRNAPRPRAFSNDYEPNSNYRNNYESEEPYYENNAHNNNQQYDNYQNEQWQQREDDSYTSSGKKTNRKRGDSETSSNYLREFRKNAPNVVTSNAQSPGYNPESPSEYSVHSPYSPQVANRHYSPQNSPKITPNSANFPSPYIQSQNYEPKPPERITSQQQQYESRTPSSTIQQQQYEPKSTERVINQQQTYEPKPAERIVKPQLEKSKSSRRALPTPPDQHLPRQNSIERKQQNKTPNPQFNTPPLSPNSGNNVEVPGWSPSGVASPSTPSSRAASRQGSNNMNDRYGGDSYFEINAAKQKMRNSPQVAYAPSPKMNNYANPQPYNQGNGFTGDITGPTLTGQSSHLKTIPLSEIQNSRQPIQVAVPKDHLEFKYDSNAPKSPLSQLRADFGVTANAIGNNGNNPAWNSNPGYVNNNSTPGYNNNQMSYQQQVQQHSNYSQQQIQQQQYDYSDYSQPQQQYYQQPKPVLDPDYYITPEKTKSTKKSFWKKSDGK
ncbi:hypothetical protein HK098_002494 [Nowakowskiella sp. JEL0407]|nr:hypothetical protein HK098_002494 [Nowakowskiella sp. JEL0407]